MAIVEALGSAPLSTAVSSGMNKFTSIFRNKPSTMYKGNDYNKPRSYVREAGLLIAMEYTDQKNPDFSKGYYFQFNPQTVTDTKSTIYETRSYAGTPYVDSIWGNGGERTVTFQLFLDDTPGSDISYLRGNPHIAENGALAYTYTEGLNVTGDLNNRTRVHERGILDAVELIQSFMYPAPLKGSDGKDLPTPRFASGGVVTMTQFRPPAKAIITIGALYYSGYVKAAPVTYELFDADLTPIRGTIDLEFVVDEFQSLEKIMNTKQRGV